MPVWFLKVAAVKPWSPAVPHSSSTILASSPMASGGKYLFGATAIRRPWRAQRLKKASKCLGSILSSSATSLTRGGLIPPASNIVAISFHRAKSESDGRGLWPGNRREMPSRMIFRCSIMRAITATRSVGEGGVCKAMRRPLSLGPTASGCFLCEFARASRTVCSIACQRSWDSTISPCSLGRQILFSCPRRFLTSVSVRFLVLANCNKLTPLLVAESIAVNAVLASPRSMARSISSRSGRALPRRGGYKSRTMPPAMVRCAD